MEAKCLTATHGFPEAVSPTRDLQLHLHCTEDGTDRQRHKNRSQRRRKKRKNNEWLTQVAAVPCLDKWKAERSKGVVLCCAGSSPGARDVSPTGRSGNGDARTSETQGHAMPSEPRCRLLRLLTERGGRRCWRSGKDRRCVLGSGLAGHCWAPWFPDRQCSDRDRG